MKKLLIILSLATFGQVDAQTVTIPDANFVAYLQSIIPAAMSGNQMDTTSLLVTTNTHTITVNNKGIMSLNGVQYFKSLTVLQCATNSLATLPALPNTLQDLSCSYNSLTTLPSLPNSLQILFCGDNNLTALPALPTSLTNFACGANSLGTIPPLPSTLLTLECQLNHLTSLPSLPNSLRYLDCSNNNIPCFPTFPNSISPPYDDPHNGMTIYSLYIYNNPFNCLPNYISAMGSDTVTYPLCAAGNSNGCPVATGIEQMEHTLQVSIYPNPTSDQFFIKTNSTDKLTVDLFDVNGRHVFSSTAMDKSNINLTSFNEGIYTVTIKTAHLVINKKLVILR